MAEYQPQSFEKKVQEWWKKTNLYQVTEDPNRPKFYVLDMFPYPSGAGLHVGHPLGYIASDIYARYKRLNGFNVLHPMGYDAFGLPAEQYAIQTGQHPAITTETNIARYRQQLDQLGFSFDWDREVRTCEPNYYRWTQWIFLQIFHAYFDQKEQKARSIDQLIAHFEVQGSEGHSGFGTLEESFSAADWKGFSEDKKESILQHFRLTYLSEAEVNWCPALGTVLSNEEVINGRSERGNHPVVRKKMQQWSMRISAYAPRLLEGLESIEWSDSIKEMQRYWIGKSEGASVRFQVKDSHHQIEVFTTRPDTIFGVSFVVLAPEHEWALELTTPEQKDAVESYIAASAAKSEIDRMAETKSVSGVFTGRTVLHPFTGQEVPIWLADYVLAGYGTGAVMGVPGGDERDFRFAQHFQLPIIATCEGTDIEVAANPSKEAKIINSDFLNGLTGYEGIKKAIEAIEAKGMGKGKTNYRLRDAIFSRQRYWGEPIPIRFENGVPHPLEASELPLILPEIDAFLPTEDGQPPLARAENWNFDANTMPGWAGSSWYFLRYMDPNNAEALVDPEKLNYWGQVDLYLGGSEHATGHLLYARFWTKFLHDMGIVPFDEPFKKLINQGMIQGVSQLVYRIPGELSFVSAELKDEYHADPMHVEIALTDNQILDVEGFKQWRPDLASAKFIPENGPIRTDSVVEKMSKSKFNVVNPDDIVAQYGADTLRLYEMFLGPIEMSKPWDTKGIEGVYRFLKKYWRLFHGKEGEFSVSEETPTEAEFKTLHKTIKKITEDIERFSYNTSVAAFMIATNDLNDFQCRKRSVLEPLTILLAPFAPHIAERLWHLLGHPESVHQQSWPQFESKFLEESNVLYPIMINGKKRAELLVGKNVSKEEARDLALALPEVQKWTEGNAPKNVIVVPGKIINIVL
jgi:leucyl-tRNA synthetase